MPAGSFEMQYKRLDSLLIIFKPKHGDDEIKYELHLYWMPRNTLFQEDCPAIRC
jgi:hypothetical protein